ncbi:hypothetical protein [Pseudoxanthomonas sp. X-1]|nr:hypothetical protein [Pseudoxanthomonas sp. X-1]
MNIRKAQPEDHPSLLGIWEQSVRASHDFLSEQDIESAASPRARSCLAGS